MRYMSWTQLQKTFTVYQYNHTSQLHCKVMLKKNKKCVCVHMYIVLLFRIVFHGKMGCFTRFKIYLLSMLEITQKFAFCLHIK